MRKHESGDGNKYSLGHLLSREWGELVSRVSAVPQAAYLDLFRLQAHGKGNKA